MAAPDSKQRNQDAQTLFQYGFSVCDLYVDENQQALPDMKIEGGIEETVPIEYAGGFRYLDTAGNSLDQIERKLELPESVQAPVSLGQEAGKVRYYLNGQEIGNIPILYAASMEKAGYGDCFKKIFSYFLL